MKTLLGAALGVVVVLAGGRVADRAAPARLTTPVFGPVFANRSADRSPALTAAELNGVVQRYCQVCHNDQLLTGNLSLQGLDVARPQERADVAERMIVKLRAGMMPPPGAPRPSADTLLELVETLERTLDRAAETSPNPGSRSFQRLNRVEYANSVRNLLGLEVDAAAFLPPDTKSANFDNIADVQLLSPTLMDGYLRAATAISRLAVGYQNTSSTEAQFLVPQWVSQDERVEGAPFGTRGGASVLHNFPADGEYVFRLSFHYEDVGSIYGSGQADLTSAEKLEQIEISIDGERKALLDVDRWMHMEDPTGVTIKSEPIFIRAGPHRATAAFIKRYEGPVADLISPFEWSIANTATSTDYGLQQMPHLRDMVIAGPQNATGISDNPVRRGVFTCRPTAASESEACAFSILSRLATQAFRRPVNETEMVDLMGFYRQGVGEGGFESGVRVGLEAILASPRFVFRFEEAPNARPGRAAALDGFALASRLSYFLWGSPPDAELVALARDGKLADPRVLEQQARRLLTDPRADALASRFLAQWLRLPDLAQINPDVRVFPDFDEQLRHAMRTETEVFFHELVKDDRSMLELFTADWSMMNERLARHYGVPGIAGDHYRRVPYPDDRRRGIFGQASVLTLTSLAGRTSPVLRGKWVMEVILGTPPPPPPPGVPDLEQTAGVQQGRVLTTRERMEAHRSAPVCNSCHRFMDPIGLSLDNFDVIGQWRIRENGAPLDTRGQLYDGTPVTSPADLQKALLARPVPIIRNFTKNLMTYALGRRVEYYDMPAIRRIARDAAANDYRMSSFILGVVQSDAFRMQMPAESTQTSSNDRQ
jgi:hypothetical protein